MAHNPKINEKTLYSEMQFKLHFPFLILFFEERKSYKNMLKSKTPFSWGWISNILPTIFEAEKGRIAPICNIFGLHQVRKHSTTVKLLSSASESAGIRLQS